ncbi:hypothetical protein EDD21DRAFT_209762 [Dissophora ornata]|nr:hypothetical protein EDD21DRAFT_209762 [Dissophora ornata]
MPKRRSPSAHRSQGRGNTRPRGGGRGGQGGQFGGAGGRRNHHQQQRKQSYYDHQPEDGYISLSARSSRVRQSASSYAGHKRSRKEYRQVEVKFNKAKKGIDTGSSGEEDSDQGLDSDEICESEEEFLEQPFDWIEADQDPNRKKQLLEATSASISQPELHIIPGAGWGGALTYNPLGNSVTPQQQPPDILVISGGVGDDRTLNTVGSAEKIIDQLEPSCITRASTKMNTSSHSSLKLAANKHKRIKAVVDLTEDDQITTSTHSTTVSTEITATDLRSPLDFKTIVSTEEVEVTKITVKNTTAEKEVVKEAPTSADTGKEPEHNELEPVLWVLDTEPDVIPAEELSDTYVELPSYLEFSSRKQKKTRRSKRGGRQLKEKEREKRKAMAANGTLLLEDDASDEMDDDQKALEDYLQNTMDHDNEDHLDAISFSLLQGLTSGPGHSRDVGGFDPDDSEFDQEDISDYGGDDDDYDDFTVPKASRQNRRNSDELAAAIDAALSLDPASRSIANSSQPNHYQPYELNHMVMHLTIENIAQMNRYVCIAACIFATAVAVG